MILEAGVCWKLMYSDAATVQYLVIYYQAEIYLILLRANESNT